MLRVRLIVCVNGKCFGVMAQRVGWETAGDSSEHTWMHRVLYFKRLLCCICTYVYSAHVYTSMSVCVSVCMCNCVCDLLSKRVWKVVSHHVT